MYGLEQLSTWFSNPDLINYLLPFLLIFAIIFAILSKIRIFGDKKNINVIVSFILAFLTISNPVATSIITGAVPNIGVVIVALILVLILIGVFGKNFDIGASSVGGLIAILAFITVAGIFAHEAGLTGPSGFGGPLSFLNDSETRSLVVIIGVFLILVWYITKEDKASQVGWGMGNILDEFKRMLK